MSKISNAEFPQVLLLILGHYGEMSRELDLS